MTPSEFLRARFSGTIDDNQLADTLFDQSYQMKEWLTIPVAKVDEQTVKIHIRGTLRDDLEIIPSAMVWFELLNIATNNIINGVPKINILNFIYNEHFAQHMFRDDDRSKLMQGLFDQFFNFITYTKVGDNRILH